MHLLRQIVDDLFVLLDRVLNVLETLSQHLDEFEGLSGDLVIVVLHLLETLGMVLHKIVAVLVLALLDLVDLDLHAKFEIHEIEERKNQHRNDLMENAQMDEEDNM